MTRHACVRATAACTHAVAARAQAPVMIAHMHPGGQPYFIAQPSMGVNAQTSVRALL
jgi:hypothetical protein